MLRTIEEYYKSVGVNPLLLRKKLIKLEKHPDIASEFAHWIEHKEFKTEGGLKVEGYTAKDLAAKSNFLYGEGAFMLMIELRDDPERAKQRINEGFTLK